MILLDTDHFSVLTDARHARHARLVTRLLAVDEPVAIPVILPATILSGCLVASPRAAGPGRRGLRPGGVLYGRCGRVRGTTDDQPACPGTRRRAWGEGRYRAESSMRRSGSDENGAGSA